MRRQPSNHSWKDIVKAWSRLTPKGRVYLVGFVAVLVWSGVVGFISEARWAMAAPLLAFGGLLCVLAWPIRPRVLGVLVAIWAVLLVMYWAGLMPIGVSLVFLWACLIAGAVHKRLRGKPAPERP
jgi:hypothetical protein